MPPYVLVLDAHAMDHIPDEDMPDVDKAAHPARRTTAARRQRLLAGLRSIGGSWPNALGRAYRRARQWPDDHRAAPVEVLARLRGLVPR